MPPAQTLDVSWRPRVLYADALAYDRGTSDKVYAVAIVGRMVPYEPPRSSLSRSSSAITSEYQVVSLWGPRGKKVVSTTNYVTGIEREALGSKNVILRKKRDKGYKDVDWRDVRYGLVDAIRALGNTDTLENVASVKEQLTTDSSRTGVAKKVIDQAASQDLCGKPAPTIKGAPCVLAKGHAVAHRSAGVDASTWGDIALCGKEYNGTTTCVLPVRHGGPCVSAAGDYWNYANPRRTCSKTFSRDAAAPYIWCTIDVQETHKYHIGWYEGRLVQWGNLPTAAADAKTPAKVSDACGEVAPIVDDAVCVQPPRHSTRHVAQNGYTWFAIPKCNAPNLESAKQFWCVRPKGHAGVHRSPGTEGWGSDTGPECQAIFQGPSFQLRCQRPKDHPIILHAAYSFTKNRIFEWEMDRPVTNDPKLPSMVCSVATVNELRCRKPLGHVGRHVFAGGGVIDGPLGAGCFAPNSFQNTKMVCDLPLGHAGRHEGFVAQTANGSSGIVAWPNSRKDWQKPASSPTPVVVPEMDPEPDVATWAENYVADLAKRLDDAVTEDVAQTVTSETLSTEIENATRCPGCDTKLGDYHLAMCACPGCDRFTMSAREHDNGCTYASILPLPSKRWTGPIVSLPQPFQEPVPDPEPEPRLSDIFGRQPRNVDI